MHEALAVAARHEEPIDTQPIGSVIVLSELLRDNALREKAAQDRRVGSIAVASAVEQQKKAETTYDNYTLDETISMAADGHPGAEKTLRRDTNCL